MKKLLLLLTLWSIYVPGIGQTYTQVADDAFVELDKSGITSGILYDRVAPVGALYAPSNFEAWTPERFMQTRMELYLASYNRAGLLSDNDYQSLVNKSRRQGIVPIGLSTMRFQMINSTNVHLDPGSNRYRPNPNQQQLSAESSAGSSLYTTRQATARLF